MEHINDKITGWFTFPRFYTDMVNKFPNGSKFVEVGTYSGKSLAYLLVEAINADKKFEVTAVDSYTFRDEQTNENIMDALIRNLEPLDYQIDIIKEQSWNAADFFEDGSVDFVFLDADHTEESVRKDVRAWLPKIKPGGIIAGHDYCHPRWYDNDHPGVAKVVHETFGTDWDKEYLDEKVWFKQV